MGESIATANDLLIALYRWDAESYGIELQFRRPDDAADRNRSVAG